MPTRRATTPPRPELEDALFPDQPAFETWLESNHANSPGIWCLFAKKDSGQTSVTYKEAVEVALCFGWIDGQARTSDREGFFRVRFVQRRPRSVWSKINRDKALALIERGRMRAPGLAQIEIAKANGQWDRAYDGASTAVVPPDLEAALKKNAKARAFFKTLDRTNRYSVLWRVQTAASAATRTRRIETLVDKLARRETFHATPLSGSKAKASKARGRKKAIGRKD
jgi:uncharacterized protein YdeI (YjbR/CyaY-like superfamily)